MGHQVRTQTLTYFIFMKATFFGLFYSQSSDSLLGSPGIQSVRINVILCCLNNNHQKLVRVTKFYIIVSCLAADEGKAMDRVNDYKTICKSLSLSPEGQPNRNNGQQINITFLQEVHVVIHVCKSTMLLCKEGHAICFTTLLRKLLFVQKISHYVRVCFTFLLQKINNKNKILLKQVPWFASSWLWLCLPQQLFHKEKNCHKMNVCLFFQSFTPNTLLHFCCVSFQKWI